MGIENAEVPDDNGDSDLFEEPPFDTDNIRQSSELKNGSDIGNRASNTEDRYIYRLRVDVLGTRRSRILDADERFRMYILCGYLTKGKACILKQISGHITFNAPSMNGDMVERIILERTEVAMEDYDTVFDADALSSRRYFADEDESAVGVLHTT